MAKIPVLGGRARADARRHDAPVVEDVGDLVDDEVGDQILLLEVGCRSPRKSTRFASPSTTRPLPDCSADVSRCGAVSARWPWDTVAQPSPRWHPARFQLQQDHRCWRPARSPRSG